MKLVFAGLCALWLGLMACSAMPSARFVNAEDDCLDGTKFVKRTPIGLVCFGEPRRILE